MSLKETDKNYPRFAKEKKSPQEWGVRKERAKVCVHLSCLNSARSAIRYCLMLARFFPFAKKWEVQVISISLL